jgi:hypothetical protein
VKGTGLAFSTTYHYLIYRRGPHSHFAEKVMTVDVELDDQLEQRIEPAAEVFDRLEAKYRAMAQAKGS